MNDINASSDDTKVTELELQLWRVFYGFIRWQEECEKSSNNTLLTGNELAILHCIRMKNRPKTVMDIERLLNRDDTHNIRYSLNKLLKQGLIKKTLSNTNGKNYFFQVTEEGFKNTNNFSKMRQRILVQMFKEANLDLEEITMTFTKVKALYDEADRSMMQGFIHENLMNATSNEKLMLGTQGNILVVEDHPTTAKVTKKILSDLNYHVDIADSGDMTSKLIEQNSYNLILMDIGLPDIDGYEMTRKIRSNKNSINIQTPIIGLTAYVSGEIKQDCISAGMNAVFTKPLMKEKIESVFSMFIPANQNTPQILDHNKVASKMSEHSLPKLKGHAIDLELGAKLVGGNEELAKEVINMLIESFTEELSNLKKICHSSDSEAAITIVHKLRGGTSYCGVPRLQEACIRFDDYLKSGKTEHLLDFCHMLQLELDLVKKQLAAEHQ